MMKLCPLLLLLAFVSCQENFDKRLQREAKEYSAQHCPQQVQEETVLDSTTYDIPTRTFTRWFTLSGSLDTPQAQEIMQKQQSTLQQALLKELQDDPKWKYCMEKEIIFAYKYRSKESGNIVFQTTLMPKDYAQ
jgi:hypothetical protein